MKYVIILFIVFVCGCTQNPETPVIQLTSSQVAEQTNSNRFSVEISVVFHDDLAYNGNRGIYIIKDHKTGKEFIGVSGIGISELGRHTIDNKTIIPDER